MDTVHSDRYVLALDEIDRTMIAEVGGKAANLGELARVSDINVPDGFCVTTEAYCQILAKAPSRLAQSLDELASLDQTDHAAIRTTSAEIRSTLERVAIPDDVTEAIREALRVSGDSAYAIRSSATAEDLPRASFAGQQDSFLNVRGSDEILRHIRRCWGSLFTERAVTYRQRHGLDHRRVEMAVVVQQMVSPEASGIAFTADPVTSNRRIVSVEATLGLGEALASGLVAGDVYKVRDGEVIDTVLATKRIALRAAPDGGMLEQPVPTVRQRQPVLAEHLVRRLATLCRQIEAVFGSPQDIEWCLVDGAFSIVQSRPITTLFPIPEREDTESHVYVSVGHGQMMTDPMRPLGLSMWRHTSPAPMFVAGGRLYVDVTQRLGSPEGRAALLEVFGRGDPLIRDALQTVIDRDFIPIDRDATAGISPPPGGAPSTIETDPTILTDLVARAEESLVSVRRDIETMSGLALLDFILEDISEMRRIMFDSQSQQAIMAAMEATWWLNDHMREWLGETNAADTLTRSAPHNVTSEMGLDLLDVADAIRPHPQVVRFLRHADSDDFLQSVALTDLEGGCEARDAIGAYLDKYGMRCVGEIDITRPRWSEHPTALVPVILGNINNFEAGEAHRRFARGRREAQRKERSLLERLRSLPDGLDKAEEARAMIDRVQTFIGYREYPKYFMITRYAIYKEALMRESERLVEAAVIRETEDIFYLSLEELHEVFRTGELDGDVIDRRRSAFASYADLAPPRVLTSEGEAVTGSYHRSDLPSGALAGLAVSAGIVEGRARIILDMASADIEEGDILVTTHTDPSWSPLFVAVQGLVTEVGGLMTHGAVIAREYGLPAVVGVEKATRLIREGQMIRVNGTEGCVELLS